MALPLPQDGSPTRAVRTRMITEDFFGHQPTPTAELPDPEPLLTNLALRVVEVLFGAREIDQLARWVTADVYEHLQKRVLIGTKARLVSGQTSLRPHLQLGSCLTCEPRDGIVEGTVIVHTRARARAVAIRLEGLDHRWRASAIHVL